VLKNLLVFFLVLINFQAWSQTTWIRKLTYNSYYGYSDPSDTLLRVLEVSPCIDGGAFIIAKDRRSTESVYRVFANGDNQRIERYGNLLSHFLDEPRAVHQTLDSGCIFAENFEFTSNISSYSIIHKYDKYGNPEWSSLLPKLLFSFSDSIQATYDIAPLNNGGYACLAMDSTFILDSSGNLVSSLAYSGPGALSTFSNGDLFFQSDNIQGRMNSLGTFMWTIPLNNGKLIFKNDSCFLLSTDTLFKLDPATGTVQSGVSFPASALYLHEIFSDGTWINYSGKDFEKYNADGTLNWSTTLSFSHGQFVALDQLVDGSILTGSSYLSSYDGYIPDYSVFICNLDTNGHGVVDSTDHFVVGDILRDSIIQIKNMLYVAINTGKSGIPRDPTETPQYFSWYCAYNDFCVDWASEFGNGHNLKYCDVIGDGIIDTADLNYYNHNYCIAIYPDSSLPLCNTFPKLRTSLSKDSIANGDTLRAYFILGEPLLPVDSLAGIIFTAVWDFPFPAFSYPIASSISGNPFGTLQDVYAYELFYGYPFFQSNAHWGILSASTDHHEAFHVRGDTVATIDFIIDETNQISQMVHLDISNLLALTSEGITVPLCAEADSVYFTSSLNEISAANGKSFSCYPNPVQDQLFVELKDSYEGMANIFDMNGKEIMSLKISGNKFTIDTHLFENGVYCLRMTEREGVRSKMFVVQK